MNIWGSCPKYTKIPTLRIKLIWISLQIGMKWYFKMKKKENTILKKKNQILWFKMARDNRKIILSPEPLHSPFCQLQISELEGRIHLTCPCDTSPTRLTPERPHFYGCRSSQCNSFPGTPCSFSRLLLPQRCTAYSLLAELVSYQSASCLMQELPRLTAAKE